MGANLQITPAAAAELGRQAAVAGTPGQMHLDLVSGSCEAHVIRLQPGAMGGIGCGPWRWNHPACPGSTSGQARRPLP